MIHAFFDLASTQPAWVQALMGVTTVLLLAVVFGFFLAVLMTLLDAFDPGKWWRVTVGSWWADRHARRMRKSIALLESEMDQERRLRAATEIGSR